MRPGNTKRELQKICKEKSRSIVVAATFFRRSYRQSSLAREDLGFHLLEDLEN